jgi:hypothetical protein
LRVENKIQRKEVVAEDQRPTLLLPELCRMTGIPDNFDENRRKAISKQTILAPDKKKREIEDFIGELEKGNHIQNLKELGIDVKKTLNKMSAVTIATPALELGQKQYVSKGREANFMLFG